MNRNYKVIWNASLNCFMAVSEYAKARGKSSNGAVTSNATPTSSVVRGAKLLRLSTLCMGLAAAGLSLQAIAMAPATGAFYVGVNSAASGANYNGEGATGTNAITLGINAEANGPDSISMGTDAGVGATSAFKENIAIGKGAGVNVQSEQNVAIGSGAGLDIKGGPGDDGLFGKNTLVGTGSGNKLTGAQNSGLGFNSLLESTGSNNVGLGSYAGWKSEGNLNIYQGNYTGSSSVGNRNVAIGNFAGNKITGNQNVFLGDKAGTDSKDSDKNIAIGLNAGKALANVANSIAIGELTKASSNSIAMGTKTLATGLESVALGSNSFAEKDHSIALGSNSVANTGAGELGFVIGGGTDANVTATNSTAASVSVGDASKSIRRQITNVAAGTIDTDAVNVAQLKTASAAAQTKYYSVKNTSAATATGPGSNVNNDGATKPNAMAMGVNASATGEQAIAIGSGDSGQNTTASGEQSIAIGANVESSGNSSIAIGGDDLDDASKVNGVNALFNTYTGSIGGLVTVGDYSDHTESGGAASVAIGVKAHSKGNLSTAVGVRSSSSGDASSAFGMGSSASQKGSVALGAGSTTLTDATYQDKLTIGNKDYFYTGATNDKGAQVSVGSSGRERQIKHVASGEVSAASTDAINGSQLHATNESVKDLSTTVVANKTHYYSVNDGSVQQDNYNNDGATGNSSLAAGVKATATNNRAVAMGAEASATGSESTALGSAAQAFAGSATAVGFGARADQYGATAMGTNSRAQGMYSTAVGQTAKATGENSIAMGKGTEADGVNSIAIGTGNQVTGDNSGAFGDPNIVSGTGSYAVGNNNTIAANKAFVLGNNVTINAGDNHSIALGESAKINGEDSIAIGRDASASAGTRNGLSIGLKSKSGNHAVSLGDRASSGNYAIALGSNSTASIGGTAIGQASHAVSDATALGRGAIAGQSGNVALGNSSITGAQHTGSFSINNIPVAGLTRGAKTVSVGAVGAERQIQNVAPGVVDATSTDAINGSQLHATNTQVNKGFGLKAADGQIVMKQLGEQVEVVGSNSNIDTRVNTVNGNVEIELNNNLDLGNNGSVTTGNLLSGTNVNRLGMVTGGLLTGGVTTVSGAGVTVTGLNPLNPSSAALTSNGLTILNGPSITKSGGVDAGSRQITNVASGGTTLTNAANIGDIQSTVAANKTKYYSVNSTGGTNDDNLGATGQNAMAMGRNSVASGSQAISIGSGASGQKTTASGEQSIAIGANVVSSGASSIAIGGDDLDAASQANLTGAASGTINGGSVNTTFKAYTGRDLVETPPYQVNTESGGAASIAMGAKALSQGALSTAIGVQSSSSGVASSAFGMGSSASAKGSVALGAGSVASVAGGAVAYVPTGASAADATAIKNTQSGVDYGAVSVGTGVKGGNRQIVNLAAGTNDSDAVNVAQLKGGVSSVVDLGLNFTGDNTTTTVNRKLGEKLTVKGGATTPLSDNNIGVEATSPGTLTVKLAKNIDLGKTGSVKMGTSSPYGLGPVTTVDRLGISTGNSLASTDVNGLGVFVNGPLGIPSTALTMDGLNIIGGPSVTRSGGVDAGSRQITNVASGGTTLTNAANIGDVKSAAAGSRTEVVKGTNVTSVDKTTGSNGQDVYTVNANGTTASAGSAAVTVTTGIKDANNVTDYKVDLSDSTKTSLSSADSALQSVVTQIDGTAVKNITKTNNTANFITGDNILLTPESGGIKIATAQDLVLNSVKMGNTTVSQGGMTIVAPTLARTVVLNSAGLNNGGNKITNVKAGEADTDAVNVGQLNLANATIDKGLNFGGDSGTDVNRKLGQKLTVKGGDTINADPATKNISVTANGADTLTVRLAKDINLGNTGSVTTGNTQVNNAGITLYNGDKGQVVLTNNGLNNGNNKITNVADGLLSTTSKDAVNGSQLFKTNEDVAKGIKIGDGNSANDQQFALGDTINVTGDNNITTTASATGVQVKLNNQLNLGDEGRMQMGNSIMNNTGFTFVGNEPGRTVILGAGGLNNGFNRITNVAAGIDPTDAATVGQLEATTFALSKGWNVSAQATNASKVLAGDSVDLNNTDGNITVSKTADHNDVSFNLNKNLVVDSVQTGDSTLNNEGLTIAGGPSITKAGIDAADTKITNVVSGDVAADSKDAINGGQLYAQGMGISSIIGGNTTYDPATGTFTNNNIGGTGEGSIDGAIASIKRGEVVMTENIQTNTTNIATNTTNIATNTTNITKNTADIVTNTANITTNTTNIKANKDKIDAGLNFGADSGAVINKPIGDGSVLSFKGGNNIKTTAEGSSIKFDLNGNINVESVTTGNTTVNNSGVTIKNGPSMTAAGIYAGNAETAPSMTAAGINAAGTKVTNVADGMAPRDAVNFGQLDAVSRGLGNSINELGYKIGEVEDDANAGISAAMAMSSLPQAFISGKPMIGGGIATYNGESAVAIGFSKMSNDGRWVMKLNGTADTQGNVGAAIGAGFHFD
ncbi:YadA-like family protein [Psychrobacter sp. ANT_H3]|uniref:YadA-like family protein n=1 Tax=Psychrobacter sp. ANT_H3 TaxID=3019444 RepID=UPI0022F19AC1|nr:YadA-like family protein [Psychrobacter sp. ANT_H3]MDA5132265.1 YadA-like family protein [Psychrobacter sp. ANT_H3]